jgi:uncharacterized protein YijF (DUF1287 family)
MSVRRDSAMVYGVQAAPTLDAVCARVLAMLTRPMPARAQRHEWRRVRARLRATFAAYGRVMRDTGISRQQIVSGVTALVRRAATRMPGAVGAAYSPGDVAAWALAAYDAAGPSTTLIKRRRTTSS